VGEELPSEVGIISPLPEETSYGVRKVRIELVQNSWQKSLEK
jgi:hypothetical protein